MKLLLVVTAASLAALACGSSQSSGQTPTISNPATSAAGSCEGVHIPEQGVIGTYCNGNAHVKVVTGNVDKTISGGTCTSSGGLFVVNAGVVTDHTFTGPRPDFLSVNSPVGGGSGQDVGATVILNNHFYGDTGRFGGTATFSTDRKTLHFDGKATDGETATIDVTC